MKILVLSSYTKGQKYQPDNLLRSEDYGSPERLARRIKELSGYNADGWYHESRDYSVPAGEMFTGPGPRQVRKGLEQVRAHEDYGKSTTIDLYFPWDDPLVSKEEGPVHESDKIVPFDLPPQASDIDYSDSGIVKRVTALIERHDLVFSLLRREDVKALKPLFETERAVTVIVLIAPSARHLIPDDVPNLHAVETGIALEALPGANRRSLREFVFQKMCEAVCRDGFDIFEEIKQEPQRILKIVQDS